MTRSAAGLVLVLAALLGAVGPAGAQEDGVAGTTYTEATYGWSITWDDDVWEVDYSDESWLRLSNGVSDVDLQTRTFGDLEPAACVEEVGEELAREEDEEGIIEGIEPLEGDDGEPIAGEEEGRAYAAYAFTVVEDGEEEAFYVECRTLIPNEAVLLIQHNAALAAYEDEAELVEELLAGLDLTGVAGGIEGASYTNPEYGWSIAWDGEVWEPEADEDRIYDLILVSRRSVVQFVSLADYDGDAAECLDDLTGEFEEETEQLEAEDGDVVRGVEDGRAYAGYLVEDDDTEVAVLIDCRTLVEDEAVLVVRHITALEDYEAEAELVTDLLAELALPEADRAG
jgi:hypothetical protein